MQRAVAGKVPKMVAGRRSIWSYGYKVAKGMVSLVRGFLAGLVYTSVCMPRFACCVHNVVERHVFLSRVLTHPPMNVLYAYLTDAQDLSHRESGPKRGHRRVRQADLHWRSLSSRLGQVQHQVLPRGAVVFGQRDAGFMRDLRRLPDH